MPKSPLQLYSGIVRPGRQIGRQIGFPTLNLPAPRTPKAAWGVYCALVKLNRLQTTWHVGVAHLGPASTYGQTAVMCETYILKAPKLPRSLAGKKVSVLLIKKLRSTKKFKTPVLMKKQIARDVAAAEKFFNLT